MKWMYDADPFAARQEVNERQAKAARKQESAGAKTSGLISYEFSQTPEVKMATPLREFVEDVIKKAISLYPEVAGIASSLFFEEDGLKVTQQLVHLGFAEAQARDAVTFLSQPSPLASNLLGSLSSLDAALEYLILNVPECDLPQRFLPSINSSDPFIISAHSGTDDLKKRWIEDKAVKEAGWPVHVVKDCTANSKLLTWDSLLVALGKRLIGEDSSVKVANSDPYIINTDEVDALGASFVDSTQLVISLFSAPIQIHILVSSLEHYPRSSYAPMYITSTTAPPYIRLHLLSRILLAMKSNSFMEPDEGFCMAVMRCLEAEWAIIEDYGPPAMSMVLRHFVPNPQAYPKANPNDNLSVSNDRSVGRRRGRLRPDDRDSNQIRHDFEAMCQSDEYTEMLATRQRLPAFKAKEAFLQQLQNNRVLIVVGETGSGKTTQLPQFILDSLILSGRASEASIIITQPRRISATSVAARVSAERVDDGSVGYAIRGESKQNSRTKLLFCTTGVVLRRLGSGDMLHGVSHIVVDEVHERSVDGDFLLLELKELLKRHRDLKVILMSATINHETFVKYFDGAPVVTIPGVSHSVVDKYLEDIMPVIGYQPRRAKPSKKEDEVGQQAFRDDLKAQGLDDPSITAIHNVVRADRVDFQLIASVVDYIVSTADKRGGILIFLPGVQEIRQCIDMMRSYLAGKQADILPLHGNLSNDEQRLVFAQTLNWKIIVATNVAETSITINDIFYVVDSGKVKENQYDPDTGLSRLMETWITEAAARQRRGRAGRTQPGICYKLYTRKQESNMGRYPVPEILRVPLESISLTIKVMRQDEDVKQYLTRAIDPPKTAAMEKAWSILEELGAVDEGGKLTPLGRHMAMLPIDLRLAKILILGTLFRCLGPVLTIAATLSSKPLFLSPMDKRDEAARARSRFSNAASDLLTDLKAYDACALLRSEGKPHNAIKTFCEENFISLSTIREITTLRNDFILSLADLGFIPLSSTPSTPYLNANSNNTNLLKAVILGGLWPRVARVHLPRSAIKFDKVQAGTVQRENSAREFKIFDLREGRVFLHPASVLFDTAAWKSSFLVYFHKYMSTKVFLRDATEVPLYALLLFGGQVSVNHVAGGISIVSKDTQIKLKAWPRIGILVNQLRRLLDVQLERCVEKGVILDAGNDNSTVNAILALLNHDGLTE